MQDNIRSEWIPAAVLLTVGILLRLLCIGTLPYGLNQDEASAGYEAYALLTAGVDRCGKSFPVLLISWGSGQNVLMTYLAIPFVALLGLSELSIRLPNAIAGCLTLFVFWRLARRSGGVRFGLLALGLLAVNPWHIMASRWALESNLFPFFQLTGIWLTLLARERPWYLVGAAGAFGLSLYAYGTAFFFLPIYLVLAVIWLRRELRLWPFLTALALFLLLAFPIALCQAINLFGWRELRLLGMTLPRLTQSRQTATSIFGGGGLRAAADNFRGFLHILWKGTDGLTYNALPILRGGIFYVFGLPTALIGLAGSVIRREKDDAPMRIALCAAVADAFLIVCNINRINMIWLPLIYFSARGCALLLKPLKRYAVLPLAVVLLCFGVFCGSYLRTFGGEGYAGYFPGLGEAVQYAADCGGTVYVTNRVNQPAIFALFYTEADPVQYAAGVQYLNADAAFRQVLRCPGFVFDRPERADVLVLHRSEIQGRRVLARFGSYAVCSGVA